MVDKEHRIGDDPGRHHSGKAARIQSCDFTPHPGEEQGSPAVRAWSSATSRTVSHHSGRAGWTAARTAGPQDPTSGISPRKPEVDGPVANSGNDREVGWMGSGFTRATQGQPGLKV